MNQTFDGANDDGSKRSVPYLTVDDISSFNVSEKAPILGGSKTKNRSGFCRFLLSCSTVRRTPIILFCLVSARRQPSKVKTFRYHFHTEIEYNRVSETRRCSVVSAYFPRRFKHGVYFYLFFFLLYISPKKSIG